MQSARTYLRLPTFGICLAFLFGVVTPNDPYRQPQPQYQHEYVEAPYSTPYKQPAYRQPQPYHPQEPEYPQQPYQQTYGHQPQQYPASYPGHRQEQRYEPEQPAYPSKKYQPQQPQYNKKPALAAVCDFTNGAGPGKVQGKLSLVQDGEGYDQTVRISGVVGPLTPGKHGLHIHMYGDFSDYKNGCKSAGSHYNPLKAPHGAPDDHHEYRHVGDLGNIEAGYDGHAHVDISDSLESIADVDAKFPIAGRAIVIHAKPDDLGRGGDEESKKTGNAGDRVACCVIVRVDPESLYKN